MNSLNDFCHCYDLLYRILVFLVAGWSRSWLHGFITDIKDPFYSVHFSYMLKVTPFTFWQMPTYSVLWYNQNFPFVSLSFGVLCWSVINHAGCLLWITLFTIVSSLKGTVEHCVFHLISICTIFDNSSISFWTNWTDICNRWKPWIILCNVDCQVWCICSCFDNKCISSCTLLWHIS